MMMKKKIIIVYLIMLTTFFVSCEFKEDLDKNDKYIKFENLYVNLKDFSSIQDSTQVIYLREMSDMAGDTSLSFNLSTNEKEIIIQEEDAIIIQHPIFEYLKYPICLEQYSGSFSIFSGNVSQTGKVLFCINLEEKNLQWMIPIPEMGFSPFTTWGGQAKEYIYDNNYCYYFNDIYREYLFIIEITSGKIKYQNTIIKLSKTNRINHFTGLYPTIFN